MINGYFITGTDTEVGKTYVSCALLRAFSQQGLRVAAMKPIASDCTQTLQGLRNDDALQLMENSDVKLPYDTVNPYCFEPAIAPHIAAEQVNQVIDLQHIRRNFDEITQQSELTIVEGAGGWLVPLDDQHSIADLALSLQLPVILVVGIRLGCINHALLSAAAIQTSGLKLAGWVANCVDPQSVCIEENIQSIQQRLQAPCLGELPYATQSTAEQRANFLNITKLV